MKPRATARENPLTKTRLKSIVLIAPRKNSKIRLLLLYQRKADAINYIRKFLGFGGRGGSDGEVDLLIGIQSVAAVHPLVKDGPAAVVVNLTGSDQDFNR